MANQLLRWSGKDPSRRGLLWPRDRFVILGKNALSVPYATKLTLAGTAADFLSTPDSSAIGAAVASGRLDFRMLMAPSLWTPGATKYIAHQSGPTLALQSWLIYQYSIGRRVALQLANGAGGGSGVDEPLPGAWADGSEHWIRANFNQGISQIEWLYSDDGVAWTSAGIGGAVIVQNHSAAPIRVGGDGASSAGFAGYIKRFEMRSPIDGAIVAGFDASATKVGAPTCPGLNGELWTINGTAAFA